MKERERPVVKLFSGVIQLIPKPLLDLFNQSIDRSVRSPLLFIKHFNCCTMVVLCTCGTRTIVASTMVREASWAPRWLRSEPTSENSQNNVISIII